MAVTPGGAGQKGLCMKFLRRVGPHPHSDGHWTSGKAGCPDIWELSDGRFAVIGVDFTEALRAELPPDAGCGEDERIVVIDRHVLVRAKRDIPAA